MADYGDTGAQAPDSSTSTEKLDLDDLLLRVKDWSKEDFPHCRKWHTVAKTEFAYRCGDQYPEGDRTALEDNDRVALTFNRIDPVVDAVVGSEITNRQEVRYIPRQVGDGPANEILTEAARWFRDECDAEHEESNAFADAATCGMGWTETRLDYEDNPDGDPRVERIDPLEMFWDGAARKANLTDARRVYRVRQNVPLEEVKARWPNYPDGRPIEDDACYDAAWASKETEDTELHENPKPRYPSSNEAEDDTAPKTVTLVQVQWYERETYYRGVVIDPMAQAEPGMPPPKPQEIELSEAEHAAMTERAPQLGKIYRGVRQVRKCYYEAFIGGEVLETGKMVSPKGKPCQFFKFVPITGKLDRNKGHFYGLVRSMKDPQHYANKWLSTTVEIMARGAKGGLMLESGAVEDPEEFEEKWAKPGGNAYFKKGALAGGAVQPKPPPLFPADFMKMTEFAINSIRECPGVSVEIMGIADRDQPASLEYQRRQSSTVVLSPLFDSLRRYRRIEGRILLFLITQYLSDGRLIRIVGDEGESYVPLLSDQNVADYDVIVDDAPSSPSQKELVWNAFQTSMPLIQNLAPPPEAIMAMLEYSPVPASVVAKIKTAVADAQKNAPPPPPSPAELKAQEAQVDLQITQQKAAAELQLAQQKHAAEIQMEREKHMLELEHKENLAMLDLRMKELERQQGMAIKAEAQRAAIRQASMPMQQVSQ